MNVINWSMLLKFRCCNLPYLCKKRPQQLFKNTDTENNEIPRLTPHGNAKLVQPLWKTIWWLSAKPNVLLPCNPAITVLAVHPKKLKTYIHTKTCTKMLTAALLIIAKI